MKSLRALFLFLPILSADFVRAGVVYSDPPGGWAYQYDGVSTNGLGACKPAVCLDGTWNGNNGSSEWDGSARGVGNGLPGGISSVNGILTIEDQDISTGGACNNRKIYFEHPMAQDPGVVDPSTILDTGVTISFRTRLTQPDIQPPAEISLPDGWGIFSGGKGHFGVHELNNGAHRGIAFSLVRANEPVNNFQFTAPGLTFNRNVQDTPGGAVDSQANNAAANPIFPINPNQFHEFWITIQANDATTGNGTHAVTIYVDGSVAGTSFNVTAGDGNDGETGVNGNFIAMGLNNSVGSGCVDIDFFAYKQGVILPQPSRDTNSPPLIEILAPTNNTAFYPAASGLTFTTSTLTPNSIDPADIHLQLNGTLVSGGLVIGGTPTSRTVSYNGLVPNRLYLAQIGVRDRAGRMGTNFFQFNTLVTGDVIALEVENYNYDDGADPCDTPVPRFFDGTGGSFLDNPVIGLVPPSGYFHAVGLSNIDYFVPMDGNADVYRCSIDGTLQVGTRLSFDLTRAEYVSAMFPEYDVTQVRSGQWMNYTHTYALSNYNAYLRVSAGAAQQVRLDKVTSAAGVANQTTTPLGTFKVPSTGSAYVDVPLTDAAGSNALVRLSGSQTLRLTALGANNDLHLNYLVLVPSSVVRPASVTSISPAPGATGVYPDAIINITLLNADTTVDLNSIRLFFDEGNVTASAMITPNGDATTITYDPPGFLATNTAYSVRLVFADSASHFFTNSWTFQTLLTIPVLNGCYAGDAGGDPGFKVRVRNAPNTALAAAFPNSIERAERHLADLILDPATGQRYPNEAAGPGGQGEFIEPVVINYEQGGMNAGYFDSANGYPDAAFPGVPAGTPDFISMAVTAYLQFPVKGVYRFGVRSDDNFRLTAGVVLSDTNLVLGQFDVPGGRADAATEFDFLVEAPGLYAMRLVYEEGQGGASLEWYSVDRTTGARTLINDATVATSIKAYQSRTIEPPCGPPLFTNLQPPDNQFFQDAASGISFTVVPSPGNVLPTQNIHMTLNGTDVTAGLLISGGGEERAVFFNGLRPNQAYTAVVTVADGQGNSSAMTVRFDTFVPADVTMIEAEDYNYADSVCPPAFPAGGAFIDNPAIGAYAALAGLSGIDFSDNATVPTANANVYRPCDPVGTAVTLDAFRPAYVTAGANDFQVWQLQSGEWLNYTRTFATNCYEVYLRVSSSEARLLRLERVDGDPTSADQTPYAQGVFLVPPTGGPTFYQYVRLTDALGQPATVSLAGEQTLRLTAVDARGDVQLNFLVLTAAGTPGLPVVATASPAPGAVDVPVNTAIHIDLGNGCSGFGGGSLRFDGVAVTDEATIAIGPFGVTIDYMPNKLLQTGSVHTVSVIFQDTAMPHHIISNQWSFTVISRVLEAPVHINFQLSGAPLPAGYLVDYGDVFADRGNGFNYGWDGDNRNTARYRQSANSPDLLHDTLEHLQKPPPDGPHFWEIALPNGQYVVHAVAGDPDNFDSVFQFDIEGTLTAPYTPSAAAGIERWVEYTNSVTVSDGRLTINNGPSASNNKICYVDITPASLALAPLITDAHYANGMFTFSFDTKVGLTYTIQYKNTLDNPMEPWQFLQNVPGTGTPVTIHDMTAPDHSRFYRVRVQ